MFIVLRDYRFGVVILLLLLPFSESHLLPRFSGFNSIAYLTLATVFSFSIRQFASHRPWLLFPSWVWLLFVAPVTVSLLMGVRHVDQVPNYMVNLELFTQTEPARYIKDLYVYPMITLLWVVFLMHALRDSKRPEGFIYAYAISALLPAVAVLIVAATSGLSLQVLTSGSFASRQYLSSIGMHANELGILLGSAFCIILFSAPAASKPILRLLLWAILSIVSLALLLTFSRGAFLSALISVLAFVIMSKGSRLTKFSTLFMIGVIIAALGGALMDRISEGWKGSAATETRAEAVSASRTVIWKALLPEVERSPFIGSGLSSTVWSSAAHARIFPTHPHNLYLEILLDMGFVGLLLLLGFYYRFLTSMNHAYKNPAISSEMSGFLKGGFWALITYHISAIANGHYMPVAENTLLWGCLAFALFYQHDIYNQSRQV